MKPWPTVSLGELLRLERRPVKVEPEKHYQEIGICCFGRGIFHKTPRTGFEVGNKDLFIMKEGDFLVIEGSECNRRRFSLMNFGFHLLHGRIISLKCRRRWTHLSVCNLNRRYPTPTSR